ncbi:MULTISPECIES: hypothetical protein [unclassified Microcoleus]|uniref:hypothetical protein n=1 Tax=unclassified Microcoleus TaxID=2642155 RepID=UPI0025F31208|nr:MULTISPECIES: hypothetical protein [unclassified Microcoleus]
MTNIRHRSKYGKSNRRQKLPTIGQIWATLSNNLVTVSNPGSMLREQEAVNFAASGGSLAPFVDLPLTALIHLTTKN